MKKSIVVLSAVIGVAASSAAHAYNASASVTFSWASAGSTLGWTSNGANVLTNQPTNTTQFATLGGNNSTTYYNPDFASASDYTGDPADDCLTPIDVAPTGAGPEDYEIISIRKFACRHTDTVPAYSGASLYDPIYHAAPITDQSGGGAATGTLTVTDNTLTGTLTVITTTDEPTGATTTFAGGVRTSNSVGDGADGYNIRSADGSPFGNVWYGITTSTQLTVNLSGTFTNSAWTINGGTVAFNDPGFACQQGGFGGTGAGTLCTPSSTGGGFQGNGGHLSWGIDTDGAATGQTAPSQISVYDNAGSTLLATLSGVLADLTVALDGTLSTTYGEFRYAAGSAGGGCAPNIRWGARPVPETDNGITCGTLSVGTLDITGTANEVLPDTEPDAFSFVDQTGVAFSTTVTSAAVTISGTNAPASISVTGGEFSVGCTGTFTSTAGTISPDAQVCVRHTSAATGSTNTDTVLTIGGISDTFTSTTVAADTDPNAFSFTAVTGATVSTVSTSNTVTIGGINTAAPISITGGTYSVGCTGTFTGAAGTISNGNTVCVRQTSSASFSTQTIATLTIGTVTGDYSVTTEAQDTTPATFTLNAASAVAISTAVTSNTVTISGINSAAPISVSGAASSQYSIGCTGTFTATAGTISNGQTVCVRHTSSAAFSTGTDTVLNVGGVTSTFTSTTIAADTTPDAFSFVAEEDVELDTVVTSNEITVAGINAATAISVVGGSYSIGCTDTFTSDAGTITNGETVCVRHTSSNQNNDDVTTTLTIGGVSAAFTSTTAGGGLREDDGGSSLDALLLALLGFAGLRRLRSR